MSVQKSVQQVNHEELENMVQEAYELQTSDASVKKPGAFIWGAPGIGKSDIVRKVAKKIAEEKEKEFTEGVQENGKFALIDRRISQFEPSDLRGIPDLDGEVTTWKPPSWLPQNERGAGILFFDELNLAAPSIQKAAYQLILDRRLGEYELPDGWAIIAAGNRLEDNANVYELPAPLRNRFIHMELQQPSADQWIDNYALENNINTSIIGYLKFRQGDLMTEPSHYNKSSVKAYPTPRSWEFCSLLIDDIGVNQEDEEYLSEVKKKASMAVGREVGGQFRAFIKQQRKADLDAILDDPSKIHNYSQEQDMQYSIVVGIAEKYLGNRDLLPKLLDVAQEMNKEYGTLLVRLAKKKKPRHFQNNALKIDRHKKWLDDMFKYLRG